MHTFGVDYRNVDNIISKVNDDISGNKHDK